MATLEFQVEVDSDVHPELYAALAAVARAGLRPERLRQLAASGLIWEHLRAKPRIDTTAAPTIAEPAPPRDAPPVLRDVVQMPVQPERRAVPRAEPAAPPERPPVPEVAEVIEIDEAPEIELVGLEPQPAPAAGDAASARRTRLMRMKASGLFNNG